MRAQVAVFAESAIMAGCVSWRHTDGALPTSDDVVWLTRPQAQEWAAIEVVNSHTLWMRRSGRAALEALAE